MRSGLLLTCLVGAVLTLLAPVTLNLSAVLRAEAVAHPRYDGVRYLISGRSAGNQDGDAAGLPAAIESLLDLSGLRHLDRDPLMGANERPPVDMGSSRSFLARNGLEGRWLEPEANELENLKVPFLAPVTSRGKAEAVAANEAWLIVRRVDDGYVYATDPAVGNVLYELDQFVWYWNGVAYVMDSPPRLEEFWR